MDSPSRCDKCGGVLQCHPDESFCTGTLRWSVSCLCPLCGPVSELDGVGFPPPGVRTAIAKRDGVWRVRLDGPQPRPTVAKVLRELLGVSPKEAISMASQSDAVWMGTEAGVEWIVSKLRDAGIAASAVRNEAADAALSKVPSEQ